MTIRRKPETYRHMGAYHFTHSESTLFNRSELRQIHCTAAIHDSHVLYRRAVYNYCALNVHAQHLRPGKFRNPTGSFDCYINYMRTFKLNTNFG